MLDCVFIPGQVFAVLKYKMIDLVRLASWERVSSIAKHVVYQMPLVSYVWNGAYRPK